MSEELKKLEELLANDRKIIEDNYKEIERLIISLQAQEELTMNEHIKVERLNNIINELFEYLKENSKQPELFESDRYYEDVLDKLQELLGSDKE